MASLAYLESLNQGVISDLSNNNIITFIKNDDFNNFVVFNNIYTYIYMFIIDIRC